MCQIRPFLPWIVCILWAILIISPAQAKNYDVFRSDYAKGAFCAAIAGACASDNNPENSFFQNPASLESGQEEDWVYDGDYNPSDNTEPGMKTSNEISDTTYMAGIARAGPVWGTGVSISGRLSSVKANSELFDDLDISHNIQTTDSNTTLSFHIPIAYKVSPQLSIGVGIVGLYYRETIAIEGSPSSKTTPVTKLPKLGLSAGAILSLNPHFRIGSWLRTPLTYTVNQHLNFVSPGNNFTFDEEVSLYYPFISATGISIMPWADARTIFIDIDVIGTTLFGFERTLDTFEGAANDRTLRAKGRKAVIEPHLAWRSPWYTGSAGTYTLGFYYESTRWRDLPGRAHAVASLAFRFSFLEPIVAVDLAKDFFGLQISFR